MAQQTTSSTEAPSEQLLELMEMLEDHDDVQHAYANFDIDEAEMEALAGA